MRKTWLLAVLSSETAAVTAGAVFHLFFSFSFPSLGTETPGPRMRAELNLLLNRLMLLLKPVSFWLVAMA